MCAWSSRRGRRLAESDREGVGDEVAVRPCRPRARSAVPPGGPCRLPIDSTAQRRSGCWCSAQCSAVAGSHTTSYVHAATRFVTRLGRTSSRRCQRLTAGTESKHTNRPCRRKSRCRPSRQATGVLGMVPTFGDIMCADHSPEPGISPENGIRCRAARASDDSNAGRRWAKCSTNGGGQEPTALAPQVGRRTSPLRPVWQMFARPAGRWRRGRGGSWMADGSRRLARHDSLASFGPISAGSGECQRSAVITCHAAIQSGTADRPRGSAVLSLRSDEPHDKWVPGILPEMVPEILPNRRSASWVGSGRKGRRARHRNLSTTI